MRSVRAELIGAALLALVLAGCDTGPWPAAPGATRGASHASDEPIEHPDRVTVKAGETLYGLAQRYRVPVRSVIDANHLTPPYRLATGTVLVLPQERVYVVKPGETLASVARVQGVDVSTLARLNRLASPYVIRSGQALALPAQVEIIRRARNTAPLPPPVSAPAPAAVAAAPVLAPPVVVARAPPPPAPMKLAEPKPAPRAALAEAQPRAAPPAQPLPSETSSPPTPEPPVEAAVSAPGFIWPVHGKILARFGPGESGAQNDGINLAAAEGTPVLAAAAGTVAYAGNELRGYGNLILIKHANGLITAYAHNDLLLVKRGDVVRRGQPIAKVGATGAVSEPQLHFEIRRGTRALDPASYLPTMSAAAGG